MSGIIGGAGLICKQMYFEESWVEEEIARELEQLSLEDLENEEENYEEKTESRESAVCHYLKVTLE